MKKLAIILFAFALAFSSVGTVIPFFDHIQTAEAKSYKSGKKSYNTNQGTTNNNIRNNDSGSTVNKSTATNKSTKTTTTKGGFSSGGLMRGLFIGGLAGLLFGSLFSDMGLIGNILGFAINAAAIIFIVFICMKIFQMMKRKKNKEVTDQWKR
ncbi:preprotein translocase subunit Tim44 [Ureibacillus sinduriensis BLB-1 = JCM 15800]|uniref:Preprotein translocase subunit Tim44 n=1 Tax=Ureibacillus sinduriensis BLB-1 = JCM 15800 TaxID=1384057 RepID=A0A0A3HWY1_9BACL|nr:preprotein translocase subunit Tim44 [Ureibacillus sinduriensis BLB-1 = JCM 15800]